MRLHDIFGAHHPVATLVEKYLAAEKELSGIPNWRAGNRDGEQRAVWAVLLGDVNAGNLDLTAYPDEPSLRFTITLNLPPCIWRLDYDPDFKMHTNPPDRVPPLDDFTIRGPNYHAWDDNKHLVNGSSLPAKLKCARRLKENIRRFDSALRWFCGETNIKLPVGPLIDLPPRSRLL